jgi:hypothetical protein
MVRLEVAGGIVTVRTGETYAFEEVLQTLRGSLDDQRVAPGSPVLLDICESKQKRSRQELMALVDLITAARGVLQNRCGVLACDPLRYGLAREFSGWAASKGIEVRVFEDGQEDDARRWLLSDASNAEESSPGA